MHSTTAKPVSLALVLGALGVVFGDIGTSPLYTIKEVFGHATGVQASPDNVIGATSAVFWALMTVVTLKYVTLVLRADNRGEGGIMALLALAVSSVADQPARKERLFLLGTFGACLFYGECIITPAISVLSAVEGLELVSPGFNDYVLPITVAIIIALFAGQRFGTAAVGRLYAPIIIVWFAAMGAAGAWQIFQQPGIVQALNPLNALAFLQSRGWGVFATVGMVVLAITGAETLYADMGHFGKNSIQVAWSVFVMPGLTLNYLGQGALLLRDPAAVENPFFLSFPDPLLIPAVMLATVATIIASQATISGAYSMTQQAIQLGLLPRMQIIHTSETESGQIYMPTVNWVLLCAVVLAALGFRNSSNLASAYGIAITGTMLIATLLTFYVVRFGWKYPLWLALASTGFFLILDVVLFTSCAVKFFQGGWFPVVLGCLLVVVMLTWKRGRELLLEHIYENDPKLSEFVEYMQDASIPRVERTAVFLVSDPRTAPQALMHNLKHNRVLHQHNLIVTVVFEDIPYVSDSSRLAVTQVGDSFWQITIRYGFMDKTDIPKALALARIEGVEIDPFSTSFFLSRETVVPSQGGKMARWREVLFTMVSRNAGSVVSYFNIPSNSVIELGSRVHI